MAQTLPSVVIPRNTWVDLYAATSIAVGTKIAIQNIGSSNARLSESASQPNGSIGFNLINPGKDRINAQGNVGAWAFSKNGTRLQVEQV